MTTANQITIGRILLIPVFIVLASYYGRSVGLGSAMEGMRWAAIATFIFAAITDGLDGFLARHFNQRSRLGTILDPLADKLLLMAGIVTVSVTGWPHGFPLWFPILVVSRDLFLIFGAWALHVVAGRFELVPHWTGKLATVAQMTALAWVMLQIPKPDPMIPTLIAGFFTFCSGILYTCQGLAHLHRSGKGRADPPTS